LLDFARIGVSVLLVIGVSMLALLGQKFCTRTPRFHVSFGRADQNAHADGREQVVTSNVVFKLRHVTRYKAMKIRTGTMVRYLGHCRRRLQEELQARRSGRTLQMSCFSSASDFGDVLLQIRCLILRSIDRKMGGMRCYATR
jgi:hypothetical protein